MFGTSQLLFLHRHPDTFLRLARKYGDVVYFKVGPREIFLVSRPDLIEKIFADHYAHLTKDWGPRRGHSILGNGLITSEGAEHRRHRQELGKLFSRKAIDGQRGAVAELVEAWSGRQSEGRALDVYHEMSLLSIDISSRVLFGCRIDPHALLELGAAGARGFSRTMFPYADRLRGLRRRSRPDVQGLVNQILEQRTGQGLLEPLLDGSIGDVGEDQIATFMLAGQETIRIATSWSWFLVSSHPSVRSALMEEARTAQHDPTSTTPVALPYAEAVLLESMRLYPPKWMIGRRTMTPYAIDGYEALPGALILMSPYVVQRDARYFPDPEKFIPERWLEPRPSGMSRYSYFPFGGGPRRCIGDALAVAEGSLMLSLIARDWWFECDPEGGSYDARLTLQPRVMRARIRAATS